MHWMVLPVLDLKPYLPVSDRVRDVTVAEWMKDWPMWMEEAGEIFFLPIQQTLANNSFLRMSQNPCFHPL